MNVMDFFRGKPSGMVPATTVVVAPTPVSAAGPNTVLVNPTVPSLATPTPANAANPNTAFGNGGDPAKAPLGNFDKMWDIDPTRKAPESPVPVFNSDPTKMMELAGTVDFTKHIAPELLARATKGDGAALVEAINKAAQAGFAHSNLATTEIVKTALTQMTAKYENDVIPRILAAERTRNHVAEDNPIFTNPAAKPVVDLISSQMMSTYPQASSAEIKSMVGEYLTGFASMTLGNAGMVVTDPKVAQAANKGQPKPRAEPDWEKLLAG